MPTEVFLMVLGSALVHATWNALIKADGERLRLIEIMSGTQIVASVALLAFVSAPSWSSWPYLLASALLNTGYMLLLRKAYDAGDLSLVYPVARGIAPLLVATVSVVLLGETLTLANKTAVLLIGLGILSLASTSLSSGSFDARSVGLALATGSFTASYTVVDGLGARAAGSPHGYMVWLSLVTSIVIVVVVRRLQQGRRAAVSRRTRAAGMAAGLMSYGASWIVIWAMTRAPFALVSALRETGIVFAVLIGVVVLNERLSLRRLASVATTIAGTALLKLGR